MPGGEIIAAEISKNQKQLKLSNRLTCAFTAYRFFLALAFKTEYTVTIFKFKYFRLGIIMRKLFVAAGLILASFSFAASQTTEHKLTGKNLKIKQELIKLEEEWHNAYVKRDASPLERILADEYIAVSGNGGSYGKTQTIEGLKNDTATYEYSTPYDMDFRFYDDAVVVIGRTKEKGKAQNGTEFTVEYRWTDVFVKKNGRWQCVAAQVVRIPPPKPKQ